MLNAMTIDVEDYFQVQSFDGFIPRTDWDKISPRVESSTEKFLELLDTRKVHGTFFMLGWIAARHPTLVRTIVDAGHELASHGYEHLLVTRQTRAEFASDIRRAKFLLEDLTGQEVVGYRAPTFSIGPSNESWAYAELQDAGYHYSSSTFPIGHDTYGNPHGLRTPHNIPGLRIIEIPMTTLQIGGKNLPISGGGWFRLLPYHIFKLGLQRANNVDNLKGVFYTHPWELDPDQPRTPGLPWKSKFRHYINLHKTNSRLCKLLDDFEWGRMDKVFAEDIKKAQ
jgi:polysaccharide deacetylase family protein (PEP-CTERM system associated)